MSFLGDDVKWPMPNVLNAVGDGLVFGYVGWLFDIDSVCEIDARVAIERCVGCGGGVEFVPIECCRICCAAASCSSSPSISSMLPAVGGRARRLECVVNGCGARQLQFLTVHHDVDGSSALPMHDAEQDECERNARARNGEYGF